MLSITRPIDALLSNRDLTKLDDNPIDSGPAKSAVENRKIMTIANDSIYLPQSVLMAANRTISSRVPSSWQHASLNIPSCI